MQKTKQEKQEKNQQAMEEDVEEMSLEFKSIDALQEYGVNAADITKLKGAGICTVKGLLMVTRKELLNIKGISDMKIDKMIEAANKQEVNI
jgi:meiotic recombination protein DMC1